MKKPVPTARLGGFTYLELLVAMAIMGLLATVAIPLAETTVRRQKENDLRQALREIRSGIDAYKAAAAAGKIVVRLGESGYPPNLLALAAGIDNVQQPGTRLYFLRRVPRDPFFADASVPSFNTWGLRSFDSPQEAPRPGADVFDVYSLSTQAGLNGVPYNEW